MSGSYDANIVQQIKNEREKASDEFRELYDLAINKVTGNAGGYQITRRNANDEPYETLWMDTPDIQTAQKVLRINQNGIAGSANGFNGPYNVAITTDGWIVAERIQAINLSAISANLGTVTAGRIEDDSGVNYWDLNTGDMNLNELKIAGKKVSVSLSEVEGNISTLQNTAQGLALDVAAADGRALNAQATADAVTLSFNNQIVGGRNLLNNGNFVNDSLAFWSNWGICSKSFIEINGKRWLWLGDTSPNAFKGVSQYVQGVPHGQKVTISFTAMSRWNETSYFDILLHTLGDGGNNPQPNQGFTLTPEEKRYSFTFTASDILAKTGFLFMMGRAGEGYFSALVRDVMFQVGDKATQFFPKEGEFSTVTHAFDGTGYHLKDSKGDMLLTPSGVANEQNIGRVDNVEAGYPMKIPFHIGAEVSQITQAVLKWDMSQFRTYSKGAASGGGTKTTPSGGGSTSGPSSKTTADNSGPPAFVSNTQTELSYPNEGKHYHRITAEQMEHSHGMAHTHTTPSHVHSIDITHEHAPIFGILETGITVDYLVGITIDGAYRATVDGLRGEIDLSAWITTNGWHELILSVNGIKRLDANLFLKTYIRR